MMFLTYALKFTPSCNAFKISSSLKAQFLCQFLSSLNEENYNTNEILKERIYTTIPY